MKDIFILQIETATPVCSVAVSKSGETIAVVEAAQMNIHASQLTIFVEEVLRKAEISMQQLDAIAISMGPGSYTGLRIGVSTAKGLCYGLNLPLLAINTLDSMVHGFSMLQTAKDGYSLVPMIDARRMEVYTAQYNMVGLAKTKDTEASIIDSDFFAHTIDNFILFGNGADKFADMFTSVKNVTIAMSFSNSAGHMSQLAYAKFCSKSFEDLIYFEPFYLKDFIATMPKSR